MGEIVLPGNLNKYSGKSEPEFRLELAIVLYQELKVPAGKAAEIAGISRMEFWEELGKRNIPLNYDVADFEQDVQNIRQAKSGTSFRLSDTLIKHIMKVAGE